MARPLSVTLRKAPAMNRNVSPDTKEKELTQEGSGFDCTCLLGTKYLPISRRTTERFAGATGFTLAQTLIRASISVNKHESGTAHGLALGH